MGLEWATRVIMGSLESFPDNHDLRYKLHYLHMK